MRTRPMALAFSALVVLTACSGSGDEEPSATLAPVTTAPGVVFPPTPGSPAPPGTPGTGIPGTTQVDFGPPPGEVLTGADLTAITGAAGYTVRETFRPKEVPGLCGEAAAYGKAWAAEAVNAEDVRLYGQVVYEFKDTPAAQAFVAGLQSAEQGCSWTSGPFTTKYVRQETGIKEVGESMFAYRASFSAAGSEASGEPGLGVYVQQGNRVIFLGAPASTTVEIANQLLTSALA